MLVRQFNYSSKEEAIEKLPEDFIKAFYQRPDGDRGWDQYKKDEQERIKAIRKVIEKTGGRSLVCSYSETELDGLETMVVIETDLSIFKIDEELNQEIMKVFANDEQHNDVIITGQGIAKIIVHESY